MAAELAQLPPEPFARPLLRLASGGAEGDPAVAGTATDVADYSGLGGIAMPVNAGAGGYELRLSYNGDLYGAAFRVAEYIKPHFEISVQPAKPEFKTGERVEGTIRV